MVDQHHDLELATYIESCFGHVGPMMEVAERMRRIPALEAERGVLLSAVEEWRKLSDQQAGKLTALEAERDQLRAEVEALRDDCENARCLARPVCDALNVTILHDAPAAIEALRADPERLDWLTFNLPGGALRAIGVQWGEHAEARAAIDAARKDAP